MNKQKFIKLMEEGMVIAFGCTDPVCISYITAAARKYAGKGELHHINVKLSPHIIKSATAVIIPGTNECGSAMSTALGYVCGDAEKKLQVLEDVKDHHISEAKQLVADGKITITKSDSDIRLYAEAEVITDHSSAKVAIADNYTNIVFIEKDGKILEDRTGEICKLDASDIKVEYTLEEIWEFATTADIDNDLCHVKKSIELNRYISEQGLLGEYGLQVGKTTMENMQRSEEKSLTSYIIGFASAGTDARMSGSPISVMSNSGSGNQGITATASIVAAGRFLNADEEKVIRAAAISNIVSLYIKEYLGVVSVLCGASIAATGASCGILYLLGGSLKQAEYAIKNMLGNVTGIVCDGAKQGCSLKVATSLQAAVQSAYLAKKDIVIKGTDGIIADDLSDTLVNLGHFSKDLYNIATQSIADIMVAKGT